jgi:Protein of unknown function (DUF2510)
MTDETTSKPATGWYVDPRVPFQLRWWDGDGWSAHVHIPDRGPQPLVAEFAPELAVQPASKWS